MKFKINKVLQYYFGSYWIDSVAMGLIMPLIAVFVLQQVVGGDVKVVGFSAAILMITRCLSQIPGGAFMDKFCRENPRRRFYFFSGNLFTGAILIFFFLLVTLPWQLYLLQALRGLLLGFTAPSINTIFGLYLDKGEEGKEWGSLGAVSGLIFGVAAALGGIIIGEFGFSYLFIIAGSIHLLAALTSLLMYKASREVTPR